MSNTNFLVRKNDLHHTLLRDSPELPLREGELRVRIDKFALTSNNITYAAFGDAMNYWNFFPVQGDQGEQGDARAGHILSLQAG